MRILFHMLLGLYPPAHRRRFGAEMLEVLETAAVAPGEGTVFFLARETAGLIGGAIREWRMAPSVGATVPYLAGAVFSALLISNFGPIGIARHSEPRPVTPPESLLIMAIASLMVLVLTGFAIAFVIHLRVVTGRRGQLRRGHA